MARRLRAIRGPLRAPLDSSLGTGAKVAALRALAAAGSPVSQRELARRAGLSVRTAQLALEPLVEVGLVRRTVGGRDYLVSLSDAHHLASPLRALFDAEADRFRALRVELDTLARSQPRKSRPLCLVIFGSAARGEETPSSDLDLFVLASDAKSRDAFSDALAGAHDPLWERFGVEVRTTALRLADARRLFRAHRPPLPQVLADAIPVYGPPLYDLLKT